MNETPDCQMARPLLGELATGAATGYERAAALQHVAGCPVCRRELTELARVADELLALAPEVEPPAGFEATVVKRILDLTDRPGRRTWFSRHVSRVVHGARRLARAAQPRLPTRPAMRLAAAGVTLIVAVSVGAAVAYWQGASDRRLADQFQQTVGAADAQYSRAVPVTTANGSVVGHVFLYKGAPSWVMVALADAPEPGDYTMSVLTQDGRRYPGGVCAVTGGRGLSGYPLPVAISQIAGIDLSHSGIHLTVRM